LKLRKTRREKPLSKFKREQSNSSMKDLGPRADAGMNLLKMDGGLEEKRKSKGGGRTRSAQKGGKWEPTTLSLI